MRIEKLKVLVCGTTFGRFYINAINLSDKFVLSGILSNGSVNSRKLAEEYKVDLFTRLDEIKKGIFDLACVVIRSSIVGGEGSEIAKELMKKGISVIQEQPVHEDEIIDNYRQAKLSNVFYGMNTFYPYLDKSLEYISISGKLKKFSDIKVVEATCSIHVLLPFLGILEKLFIGVSPFYISSCLSKSGCYTIVTGNIKGKPLILNIQNQINPGDPDNYYNMLYRISISTNSGNLLLTEANGFITWQPRIYHDNKKNLNNIDNGLAFNSIPIMQLISGSSSDTINCLYKDMYPKAILNYLRENEQNILSGKFDKIKIKHCIEVCRLWKNISKVLGSMELISEDKICTLIYDSENFKKI